ncbi:glycerophosphodiester phosphodiesterase [Micrococcus luteus]|uniref:glycerophosphodiester phosphodiesterase n=1 Tax=Micrococcus luteus TaxID=1270 RepID=UPI00342E634B|nr:glycerophosphodiester phosphodiesterase [Micrococcus luteus]
MSALVIAHRGASAAFPEHTRAAMLHALAVGADGLECDVQLTRDREVVCWHDPTVDRTSDGRGAVADHTLEGLRALDVVSWHARGPGAEPATTTAPPAVYGGAGEQVLTLADLLAIATAAGRPLRLAVELKHPSPFGHELEERVLRELLRAGWDPETGRVGQVQVSLMSFHPDALRHVAPLAGTDPLCPLMDLMPTELPTRLARGPLSRAAVRAAARQSLAGSEALVWRGRAGMAGPSVAYVREHLADVKAWLAAGRRLRVWTVDEREDADFLLAQGVQELTTNRPEDVLRWVRERAAARRERVPTGA